MGFFKSVGKALGIAGSIATGVGAIGSIGKFLGISALAAPFFSTAMEVGSIISAVCSMAGFGAPSAKAYTSKMYGHMKQYDFNGVPMTAHSDLIMHTKMVDAVRSDLDRRSRLAQSSQSLLWDMQKHREEIDAWKKILGDTGINIKTPKVEDYGDDAQGAGWSLANTAVQSAGGFGDAGGNNLDKFFNF